MNATSPAEILADFPSPAIQVEEDRQPEPPRPTANPDLTLDICSEDGSRTQFYQSDGDGIGRILRQLLSPRLFAQPLLTLVSEHCVSAVPSRTIDLILARTPAPPPLVLPPGWLDIVEAGAEALHGDDLIPKVDGEGPPTPASETTTYVEIHTSGDWMIHLRLQTRIQTTIQEQRQFLSHFFDLPVIPFRLEGGGVGFINPPKITRVTVYPPFNGVAETALPADLLRCVRS